MPVPPTPLSPDPPGSNAAEQARLDRLVDAIENAGKPNREQGIVALRAFLQSRDPRVRLDAARMLYEMKDRSGYATLLDLLRSPDRVLSKGGGDLRGNAAEIFARYREHWADEELLSQYEKTKSVEMWRSSLALRIQGMVPHLHDSLKIRMWADSIEGLAMLDPQNNQPLFQRIIDNHQAEPPYRVAAVIGGAMSGDAASLDRLIAVATNAREALPGNHEDVDAAQERAAIYLTNFRGERVVKVFEDMLTWKKKESSPSIALVYLRYHYPRHQQSREIIKAGLQPGGAKLGWSYPLLLHLARLSGDPELLTIGRKTDYYVGFRELDVRAGWSNAWIGEILPDWEGDW